MAHYTPVCEISEILSETEEEAQEEEEAQYSSPSPTSLPPPSLYEYPHSKLSSGLGQINENTETEFDKMNLKTAKEVIKIRQSVHDAGAQASQNMFDRRNQANREWQEMETSGRAERQKTYFETVEALQEIEDLTEEELKAQEEALNKFKIQKEKERLNAVINFKKQEHFIATQHHASISGLEYQGLEQRKQVQANFEKDKQQIVQEIVQVKKSENATRGEIFNSHQEQLRQMKKEMEEKLEIERQKQLELSRSKPKKKYFGIF